MNMSPDNEFTELRRLLRLKRHEQPPPGYFHHFSANVIAALQTPAGRRAPAESPANVPGWILGLLERIQARPAFAGGFATMLCAGVIGGILLFEKDARAPMAVPSLLSEVVPVSQPMELPGTMGAAFEPVTVGTSPMLAGTNLQLSPQPSLFDMMPPLDTATVGHRPQ
jgi:hypothetical protein